MNQHISVDGKYTACLIKNGDRFGWGHALTHDKDDPLVEFWHGGPVLPFLAGRYYASTLLKTESGLNLGDGFLVSDGGMAQVRAWIRGQL